MLKPQEETYSFAERAEILDRMDRVIKSFYYGATRTGCHTFIEFAGLLGEFHKLCAIEHENGRDFTNLSIHTGNSLPVKPHNLDYLAEKLTCIFGTSDEFWIGLVEHVKGKTREH